MKECAMNVPASGGAGGTATPADSTIFRHPRHPRRKVMADDKARSSLFN
jgi:hypothetical protein